MIEILTTGKINTVQDLGRKGWHILGFADIELFDPNASKPSLMRAGDTVRFTVAGIET